MRTQFVSLLAMVCLAASGCSFFGGSSGDDTTDPEPIGGALTVSGSVVDFQGGAAVAASVSISVSGITPPPAISAEGAEFTITPVPENSIFQILASATGYRPTYSQAIEVRSEDLHDLRVPVVQGAQIDAAATAFGITPTAAKGIVIVKLTDASGAPRAGIPQTALALGADARGPYFLDEAGQAAVDATTTTASGLVVWFEVAPGTAQLVAAANANVTIDMAVAPVAEGTITLGAAKVVDGAAAPLPTNVSFSQHVLPIFEARGCPACHTGNGAGRDLGGLTLNGGAGNVYKELVTERARVSVATPEASLVLIKPLKEEPPNHQNATFQNAQDPDYLKILVWIREGAKDN